MTRRPRRGARAGRTARGTARRPLSVGLRGQLRRGPARAGAARRGARRRDRPDLGPRPAATATCRPGSRWTRPRRCASATPRSTSDSALDSMAAHVQAMLELQRGGRGRLRLRQQPRAARREQAGVTDAFAFPGFVPAYIRPLFCEGKGPFRWVALSGDPEDIYRTDELVLELFPDDAHLRALDHAGAASACSSRACRRASAGSATASGRKFGLALQRPGRARAR